MLAILIKSLKNIKILNLYKENKKLFIFFLSFFILFFFILTSALFIASEKITKLKNKINLERMKVDERVRDIVRYKKNIYLFFENSPSIGVITFN